MKGTVKFFNEVKEFGFITPEDGSDDVFVHKSGLEEGITLDENDVVEFEVEKTDKGLKAVKVKKAA